MARKTHTEAQARYDKIHRRVYGFRLHNEIDSDIIAKLSEVDSMQGYIKQLIREDISRTRSVPDIKSAPQNSDSVPVSFRDPYPDIIAKAVETWIDNATSVLSDNKPYIVSDSVPENKKQ